MYNECQYICRMTISINHAYPLPSHPVLYWQVLGASFLSDTCSLSLYMCFMSSPQFLKKARLNSFKKKNAKCGHSKVLKSSTASGGKTFTLVAPETPAKTNGESDGGAERFISATAP